MFQACSEKEMFLFTYMLAYVSLNYSSVNIVVIVSVQFGMLIL